MLWHLNYSAELFGPLNLNTSIIWDALNEERKFWFGASTRASLHTAKESIHKCLPQPQFHEANEFEVRLSLKLSCNTIYHAFLREDGSVLVLNLLAFAI